MGPHVDDRWRAGASVGNGRDINEACQHAHIQRGDFARVAVTIQIGHVGRHVRAISRVHGRRAGAQAHIAVFRIDEQWIRVHVTRAGPSALYNAVRNVYRSPSVVVDLFRTALGGNISPEDAIGQRRVANAIVV